MVVAIHHQTDWWKLLGIQWDGNNTQENMCNMFKAKLDKWLEKVPDEPSVRGLTPGGCDAKAKASNSKIHQARRITV